MALFLLIWLIYYMQHGGKKTAQCSKKDHMAQKRGHTHHMSIWWEEQRRELSPLNKLSSWQRVENRLLLIKIHISCSTEFFSACDFFIPIIFIVFVKFPHTLYSSNVQRVRRYLCYLLLQREDYIETQWTSGNINICQVNKSNTTAMNSCFTVIKLNILKTLKCWFSWVDIQNLHA